MATVQVAAQAARQSRLRTLIRRASEHHEITARLLQAVTLLLTAHKLAGIMGDTFREVFQEGDLMWLAFMLENRSGVMAGVVTSWAFWRHAFEPLAIGMIVFWLIGKLSNAYGQVKK